MAEQVKSRIGGLIKALTAGAVGLGGGVIATYATAIVDHVAKPDKPLANFAVIADGLTVTCQNHATGDSGWWDFGDGSPLDPFAADQPATHTYQKPGDYAVKLTVQNFLGQESERSVPVDLKAAAPKALPPVVTMTAEAVNAVAPATFRITGQVANAEKVIWDFGDGKTDVTTESGEFHKLVVFEKPGAFPIQVIGLAGKTAVKKESTVNVAPPAGGALSVVLHIVDTASNGITEDVKELVRVKVPADGVVTSPAFEVVRPARPNRRIDDAVIRNFSSPAVRNVRAEVSPDKSSVKITGEWALSGEALVNASSNGRSVMIPVNTVQEKLVEWRNPIDWSQAMAADGSQMWAALTMPPMPHSMENIRRQVRMEIRQTTPDGRGQVLLAVPDVSLPWSGTVPASAGLPGGGTATATMIGDQLKVTISTAAMPVSTTVLQPVSPPPMPAAVPAPPPAHLPPAQHYHPPSAVEQFRRAEGVR